MTGNVVDEATEIKDLSDIIGELNKTYLGKPIEYKPIVRVPATRSDRELIDLIRSSRQATKFDKLFRGDWQGNYDTQSSADFALASILAYWTQDESQIDSIFRSSGLYRPKWDNSGGYYGRRTIRMALGGVHGRAEM